LSAQTRIKYANFVLFSIGELSPINIFLKIFNYEDFGESGWWER